MGILNTLLTGDLLDLEGDATDVAAGEQQAVSQLNLFSRYCLCLLWPPPHSSSISPCFYLLRFSFLCKQFVKSSCVV